MVVSVQARFVSTRSTYLSRPEVRYQYIAEFFSIPFDVINSHAILHSKARRQTKSCDHIPKKSRQLEYSTHVGCRLGKRTSTLDVVKGDGVVWGVPVCQFRFVHHQVPTKAATIWLRMFACLSYMSVKAYL